MADAMRVQPWLDAAVKNIGQHALNPLFIASLAETKLDDVAEECVHAAPDDLALKIPLVPEADRGLLHAGAAILAVAFLAKAGMWPLNFWLVPYLQGTDGRLPRFRHVICLASLFADHGRQGNS